MDLKIFVKARQLQHRRLHQNAFQRLKGFVACSFPFISDSGLLQEVVKGAAIFTKFLMNLR